MLDLRLLRFFIAIYEEKNITAAAARCHVSQPSLSAGLRQLEESLGDSLFIRGKKGFSENRMLVAKLQPDRLAELESDKVFLDAMLEGTTQTRNVKIRLDRASQILGSF